MDMKIKSLNRFGVRMALVALCAMLPATAFAQWEVVDKDANGKLEQIQKQNLIGGKEKNNASGEEVEKPKEKLVKRQDDEGVSQCAKSTSGTAVSDEQKKTCELIQRTRNAQYNYMVAMYDITAKRLERLRAIEKERQGIKADQLGRLEDNTNKLIALKALMDIDRQQAETAMFAYEKRLAFLTEVQSAGARAAMNGQKPPSADGSGGGFTLFPGWDGLGDIASKVIGGAAMAGALQAVKSQQPDGFQKLSID